MVMPGVTTRKPRVKRCTARAADCVDRLPCDQHGHHGSLAGPSSELQRQPGQLGVRLFVCPLEVFSKASSGNSERRCDLDQPDRRLHRLVLAEEGADIVESMVTPVMQLTGRLRRDPPLTKIREGPPAIDGVADTVDGLRQLVLLIFRCDLPRSLIQVQLLLGAFALLRRGDRRDERDLAPPVEDAVGGLAVLVKLPVLCWVFIG